jgi:glycosyltransferase involved in cell wall biosynthesis
VRGFYVVDELRKKGINCDIIYGYGKRVYANFLLKLMRHDIIYFQKRYSIIDIKLNKLARLMGKKTIFDIDDAPGGVGLNPEVEKRAIEMIKTSSAVIVGSHKLRDFAQNFNKHVYLMPSSINLSYYRPNKKKENESNIVLGWIGNGINYKKDLQLLISTLKKLAQKYNHLKLVLVGALGQKEIHQNFNAIKNIRAEIVDSIEWADPLAIPLTISNFDIGLYPLLDNEYNRHKCGFKALEYMGMGIPVVASPIGENKFIIENGKDGFLASSEKEWEESISYLIENQSIREKMGKKGRDKIEINYSLEVCANKLKKIFEGAKKR